MKLFEISQGYRNLLELLESGEVEKELIQEGLNQLDDELVTKLTNITYMVKEMESAINGIGLEQKRLADRKKFLNNSIDSLKRYMESCLILADKKSVKGDTFSWRIQANPVSVKIDNTSLIPSCFLKEVVEYEVDKKAILQAYKENGELIEGTTIEQGQSIRIR